MQSEFGAGQIQGKRIVIGIEFGTTPGGHAQTRTVGGDHAPSVPAMRIDEGPSPIQQCRVAPSNTWAEKPRRVFAKA
ncbi:MAG: hypothetical protein EPN49_10815 [Rhodanobacter sp.]|nr:MAG: hypothetical protein EPN49_10815 [Rhodanobacter sp.]